jgi:hypothetical protein
MKDVVPLGLLARLCLAWGLWLVATSGPLLAQGGQATISGTVTDSLTNEPLPFANVFVANTTLGTSANAEGRFVLPPAGANLVGVLFGLPTPPI